MGQFSDETGFDGHCDLGRNKFANSEIESIIGPYLLAHRSHDSKSLMRSSQRQACKLP